MTPTTATTEATTQAIERYLADNPGNEPISTLGMTADGRIVRLAEQDECQQSALRQVFEDQLGALMPREIDGAPRKRMIENSLSAVQTLGDYRDRIQRDWQIRNRLKTLKVDYADKFAVMHKRTETILDHLGQTETKGEGFVKYKEYNYFFSNLFTRKKWEFRDNWKRGGDARDFYLSNVIVHQLEWTFQQKDRLLELPETIEQQNISNDETMHVLHKHQSNFDSDDFCHNFLETTPNGKSIVRVAQDLGLKIDHLTVKHYDKEVDKIVIDETTGTLGFSVIAHVIPDPAVYGA